MNDGLGSSLVLATTGESATLLRGMIVNDTSRALKSRHKSRSLNQCAG